MSRVLSNKKLRARQEKDLALDVLAPLRAILIEDLQTKTSVPFVRRLLQLIPQYNTRIFAGGMTNQLLTNDESGAILLVQEDSDTNWQQATVTDYCRMLCFGASGSGRQGYSTSASIRDSACSILRGVNMRKSLEKMIYSIGIGSDRSRLDTATLRPYADIELTVISNIRRVTTE